MGLLALPEEEQIAMALRNSMQYPEVEERHSRMPIVTATDDARGPPLPMDSEEVCIAFLHDPHFFSDFKIDSIKYPYVYSY